MANPKHLEILQQGVEVWNTWRIRHPEIVPDLIDADLREVNLDVAVYVHPDNPEPDPDPYGIDFSEALLERVLFNGHDLWMPDFRAARLVGAEFEGARIQLANLQGASLRGATLFRTNIFGSDMTGTDCTSAIMGETVLSELDLSTAIGLEAVDHRAPSIIGFDTLIKSHGTIPTSFLRGCGIPDVLIVYLNSLLSQPIRFYSCFISYSTKDAAFAARLYADLQDKGVRCWFAPHDIKGGRKLHDQIDEAIRVYDRLLLILSDASMGSEWVRTEISKALRREKREARQMLFPVRLCSFETLRNWECFDGDTGKDSAREIREYYIPDFSNWQNYDSYHEAFDHLLRDLMPGDPLPPYPQKG